MENNNQSAGEAGMRELITNFRNRSISVEEHARISEWLEASEGNELLFEEWIRQKPGDARSWAEVMNLNDPRNRPEQRTERPSEPVVAHRLSYPGRRDEERSAPDQQEHSRSPFYWRTAVMLALLGLLVLLLILLLDR